MVVIAVLVACVVGWLLFLSRGSRIGERSLRWSLVWGCVFLTLQVLSWLGLRLEAALGYVIPLPGLALFLILGMFMCVPVLLTALVLGVGGMVLRGHDRMRALLGTVVSVLILVVAWYTYVWPQLTVFVYG